jgi:hypothetical protein
MTQQIIYQATVCVLCATKTISKGLEPAGAAFGQKRVQSLEIASRRASELGDSCELEAC